MKRWIAFLCVLFLFGSFAIAEDAPRIVLLCRYQEMGWSCCTRVRFMDEDGGIWFYESEDMLPTDDIALLDLLIKNGERYEIVDETRRQEMMRLLEGAKEGEIYEHPEVSTDAPSITYYAVRYDDAGKPEMLLLAERGGASRDNTDTCVQALYKVMVEEGLWVSSKHSPPIPFEVTDLASFFGYPAINWEGASVIVTDMECEDGPIDVALSPSEEKAAIAWLANMKVKDIKLDFISTSSVYFEIFSPDGERLAIFEFYAKDALAIKNGAYPVESAVEMPECLENLF